MHERNSKKIQAHYICDGLLITLQNNFFYKRFTKFKNFYNKLSFK